ncbi:glycosyl hydrolase 108 family protein [Nostoc sp.]|uniref:glycosyl hydrolase 108 family protein n=1 Tax=Nostoc sp. TaxID=1180 RepID=UPI002FF7A3EC
MLTTYKFPGIDSKRRRMFTYIALWFLCSNIMSLTCFLMMIPRSSVGTDKLLLEVKTELQEEKAQISKMGGDISTLKKQYQSEGVFREGLKLVLAFEGGLSNDAADTGGLTNFGITHTEYDEYRRHRGESRRSVANISLTEANDIYRTKYWIQSGCSTLARRLAIACFDWQVNSNRGYSTLQQALDVHPITGHPNHVTDNELVLWERDKPHEDTLLGRYFDIREDDYQRWGVGSQRVFLQGWMNRSRALRKYLGVV